MSNAQSEFTAAALSICLERPVATHTGLSPPQSDGLKPATGDQIPEGGFAAKAGVQVRQFYVGNRGQLLTVTNDSYGVISLIQAMSVPLASHIYAENSKQKQGIQQHDKAVYDIDGNDQT